jgi:tetratricopeptide (TPR) repeat protein
VLRKRRKLSKQEINELDQRLLGVDEDGLGLGEESETYEDEVVDINPTFGYEVAAVMVSLAYFYFDIDDYNTARKYATNAVKLDPTLTSAHRMLGTYSPNLTHSLT